MTDKFKNIENKNVPASIILADAMGRYSAYDYCMHQIDSLGYTTASGLSHELRQLRAQIEARWMDAADDVQMIAADLETEVDAGLDMRNGDKRL